MRSPAGLLLLCVIFLNTGLTPAQELRFERQEEGILFSEGQTKILFYQAKDKSARGVAGRANYIHPLYDLNGEVLTEDFPEDHLHHRGVFWAWHQVLVNGHKMGDAWECRDFSWEVTDMSVEPRPNALQLSTVVLWKSPDYTDQKKVPIPFVEERSTIRVFQRHANYRVIDLEISLIALQPNVRIGGSEDNKGYGGFSVRMKMSPDLSFYSDEGPVTPLETAVTSGKWMGFSGILGKGDSDSGMLVIDCNDHVNGKYQWILRETGSMQNAVFPGRSPVPVPENDPLILKYRLVVFEGRLPHRTILELVR